MLSLSKKFKLNQKKDVFFLGACLSVLAGAFVPALIWMHLVLFGIVTGAMISSSFAQKTKRILGLLGLTFLLAVYRFQYAYCFFWVLCLGFFPSLFVALYPKMSKKWPHLKEKASVFHGLFSVFFFVNFLSDAWSSPSSGALNQMRTHVKSLFAGRDQAFVQDLMMQLDWWYSVSWLISCIVCFFWGCFMVWVVQCFASRSVYHLGATSALQTTTSDYGLIVFAQVVWLFFSAESHMCLSIMIMSLLPFAAEGLAGFYRFFKGKSFKPMAIFVAGVLCILTVVPLVCLTMYRFFAPFLGVKKQKKSKGKA
jgi:hypothetical protein